MNNNQNVLVNMSTQNTKSILLINTFKFDVRKFKNLRNLKKFLKHMPKTEKKFPKNK